jgi:hypothetical protein
VPESNAQCERQEFSSAKNLKVYTRAAVIGHQQWSVFGAFEHNTVCYICLTSRVKRNDILSWNLI